MIGDLLIADETREAKGVDSSIQGGDCETERQR